MDAAFDVLDERAGTRPGWVSRGGLLIPLVLITAVAVVLQTASVARSSRVAWAVASLAVTVLLLVLVVVEGLTRMRAKSLEARADSALQPVGQLGGKDADELPWPVLLAELTSCVARALKAAGAVLVLQGQDATRVTSGTMPSSGGDLSGSRPDRLVTALLFGGVSLGSLEVVAPAGHRFKESDGHLFDILAGRVATRIERGRLTAAERRLCLGAEHARRRVNLLARSSIPLAPALDKPEEAIKDLAEIVVPEFADVFAVDLVREGGDLERIVVAHSDPDTADAFADHLRRAPQWTETLRRVMAGGQSELGFVTGDAVGADPYAEVLMAQGLRSWVMAPITVRGVSVGAMTLATRDRRGYRPSDKVTVDDLAARSSMALERGVLYREARRAARDASELADKLTRLVESTIGLTRTLVPTALLPMLAEHATGVLQAPHARITVAGGAHPDIEWGPRPAEAVGISTPLTDHHGQGIGRLTVERPASNPFAPSDGAVLTMLAGSAAVAEHNAGLYQDVRDREHRLQALIEASPLAILELETTGAVHVANPAAQALFPVGRSNSGILVQLPVDFREHMAALAVRTARGERTEGELSTTDGAGDRRHLLVSTAPVSEGGSVRMLVVITDMTLRKRLEEELAEAQRFEGIATLAGGVAHDFNNLLTVILGYSDLLLGVLTEASPEREQVEAIQEAGNHAAVITNQLLTLSRHQVLHPETIDPVARCVTLVPMLRRLVGESVTIEARYDEGSRIQVDPGQLEQVLFNLVLNSRDALPDGGRVDIEVTRHRSAAGEDRVSIRVADDGEGMSPETLAQCRQPFFTTKGRSRGMGLGLATVASILERSGGTLEIRSELGEGTAITALFPSAGETDGAPAPSFGHGRARVLLVDDDEAVRRFARRVLTQNGYEVTAVGDGASAIVRAEEDGAYDLLVTDVVLPVMSGFDLVREVNERWPVTACLLITGYAGIETPSNDVDATPLVTKPFTAEDLVNAAGSALQAAGRPQLR